MVAHSKHHKLARRKQPRRHSRKRLIARVSAPASMPPRRPVVQEEAPPREDEEPRPEDLAKEEEALKAQGPELAVVVAEAEAHEAANARSRERTSYDGDTAIKLYLREIGQVKLLTPQEEIELAARIKRGTKEPGNR